MSETRRILPADVLAAYKKTGVRPERNLDCGNGRKGSGFFNFRKSCADKPECACGLGAMFLAQNNRTYFGQIDVAFWLEKTFERNYRQGFAEGFDGDSMNERQQSNQSYREGYQDGLAAADAVFGCLPRGA